MRRGGNSAQAVPRTVRRPLGRVLDCMELEDRIVLSGSPIAVDTTSSAATPHGGAGSLSFSHTVNAGSNGILVVSVDVEAGAAGEHVGSITYDGQALTKAGVAKISASSDAEIWYLLAPPAGTGNVVVSLVGGHPFVASATDYFNVDQTTPLGTFVAATGNSTTPSTTVASGANQLVVDTLATGGDAQPIAPSAPGQTQLWSQATGSTTSDALGGGSYQAGTASASMSWTQTTSENWALAAIPLNPANVGDTPAISAPGSASVNENNSLVFSSGGGNAISVSDPDSSGAVQLSLSVTNGALTLGGTTGLTFTSGSNGMAAMTIQGTLTDVNTALDGLTYTPTTNYSGSDSLALGYNDLGTGGGGIETATTTVALTVVSTTPINTVPGAQTTNANTPLVFSSGGGNSISVADAAGDPLQETLTATNGTLTLSGTTGLSFTSGTGSGDATMTFSGTIADINNALAGLTFQPNSNYYGSANLQVVSTDNSGSSPVSTFSSIGITVNAGAQPTNTVPGPQNTNENTALVFSAGNGNQIQIVDGNFGSAPTVTLSATNGTLSLGSISGLSFTGGTGTGDATMTFSGTVANINSALASVTFQPTNNFSGTAGLQITTTDNAASPASSTNSVSITVQPTDVTVGGTPIVIDNSTEAGKTGASLTFSHTVNSGADPILIVEVESVHGGAGDPVASVTYGGQSLTEAGQVTLTADETADIWYLLAPPVGTANVVVNMTGSNHFVAGATDYFGVDQTVPFGSVVTATGSSSTPSVTLASAASQLVIDSLVTHGDAHSITPTGPGQTLLWTDASGGASGDALGGGSYQAGAASVTMSWSSGGNDTWAIVALGLNPAAPSLTLPASESLNANTTVIFSSGGGNAITVTDPVAGSSTMQLSLSVSNGTLTLNGTNGLTFTSGANRTDSMTVQGTLSAIDAALDGLSYTPNFNYAGGDSLAVSYTDLGDSETVSGSVALTVLSTTPVNTVPGAQSTNENTALVFSAGSGNQISVAEQAGNPLQETLTATNGTLTLASTTGLTFTSGTGAGDATMTFTGSITDINNALDGLSFQPTNDFSGPTSVQITSTDNSAAPTPQSTTSTVNITVNHVNATPVNTVPSAQTTNENTSLVFSAGGGNQISVSDPAAGNNPLQITLSVTDGTLTLNGTTGLTFTNGTGTGDTTATFTGMITDINNALNGLSYSPTSNYFGPDTLQITSTDYSGSGGPQSATSTVSITVTHVNAVPVNSVPGPQTTNENTALVFSSGNGNQISVSDAAADSNPLQETLTATNGTLSLNGTTGLTFSSGTGTGDTSMTFTGTLTDINNALDGLSFQPTGNYSGAASVQIASTDYTGSGGPQTATGTVNVTVNHVNTTPVNTVPGAQTTGENTAVVFSFGNSNQISVSDPAAGSNPLQETLTATNGTLTLNGTTGLTFTAGTGTGDATMTFTGTLTDINNALDGLSFQPTANYSGAAAVQITSTDNTGVGLPQSASDSVGITVNHVNGTPTIAIPAAQTTGATNIVFSTGSANPISIADATAGNAPLQITLSVTNGNITLNGTAGLTFTAGTGTGDATTTFTGTLANINAALNGMNLQLSSTSAQLQITASDSSGSGGPTGATATVSVQRMLPPLPPPPSDSPPVTSPPISNPATPPAPPPPPPVAVTPTPPHEGGAKGPGDAPASSSPPAPPSDHSASNAAPPVLVTAGNATGDNWVFTAIATASPSHGLKPTVRGAAPTALAASFESLLPWNQLDSVAKQLSSPLGSVELEKVGGAAALFTAGYVFWFMRGGALLASMVSSLPAWQSYDPLPILDFADKKHHDELDDENDANLPAAASHRPKRRAAEKEQGG